MDTARYAIAVLLVVTIPPAIGFWFIVHPLASRLRGVPLPLTYTMLAIGLGAVVANLCCMTGPALEGYARHFGWWHPFQSHPAQPA